MNEDELRREIETEYINEAKDAHYENWIDSNLDFLKDEYKESECELTFEEFCKEIYNVEVI